ncbi:LysR family transcriptional regulator [Paenibacillus sp. UNC451MF]|uniref:LysR family transcriptional regulator n=1 Tax=Paenibacillus sp. UNC451MF TaxID=1449063 RepID=UPI000490A13A|nr:LysR family transcriptional regulator [Paenibacillus sp. UNC451MF]
MHLEQLEIIVEVAKAGSLTAAAQNLHVTLSAVSQSISNLEAELKVTLFTRSRSGAAPTAEGKVIIQKAVEVLDKLQELRDEAGGYSNTQCGELRIATIPGPLFLYLDTILGLKKQYPNIQMEIMEKGTHEIIDDVRHNKIDMGLIILFEPYLEKHAGLIIEPLMEGKVVVCISRKSPLALNTSISPEELKKQPLVLYNDDYLKWYMDQFQERYGDVTILFSTNNKDAIRRATEDGTAVTIGLDYSFRNQPEYLKDEFVVIELNTPVHNSIHLSLVTSKEKKLSNTSKIFINNLRHTLHLL